MRGDKEMGELRDVRKRVEKGRERETVGSGRGGGEKWRRGTIGVGTV